jgi:hypothetical protein
MSGRRQAKLTRSSRWKTGPSTEWRPLGSECCVATGDSDCEAYTAIAWGVGLSHERSDIAGAESFHSLECNNLESKFELLINLKAAKALGSGRICFGVGDRNTAREPQKMPRRSGLS